MPRLRLAACRAADAADRDRAVRSACCVYGLTFTSHFYGAHRTVGYVPFNSETLVTGKLFEDIRESVFKLADPDKYDAIVVINLCVPTASGVPLRCCPRRSMACASSASTCPASACPPMRRRRTFCRGDAEFRPLEAEQGPVQAPRARAPRKPTVTLLGEMFPADPVQIGAMLELLGLAAGPVVPTREWRELYGALDCAAVAAIHPFYTACVREFEAAGRPSLARRLSELMARQHGSMRSVTPAAWLPASWGRRRTSCLPAIKDALAATPIRGRITLSGYEGSELLVGRLLVESGADLRYVGTACPRTRFSEADREWLEARASRFSFAPRSNRISRRSRNSSRIWRSARPLSCKRRRSAQFRRSISPT